MIIDCHGHYTTAPKELEAFRQQQIAALSNPPHARPRGTLSISDDQIRAFQDELGRHGFVWQFITLAGFHVDSLGITRFSRAYLRHLLMAREPLAVTLHTIHNVTYYQALMRAMRAAIAANTFERFSAEMLSADRPCDEEEVVPCPV